MTHQPIHHYLTSSQLESGKQKVDYTLTQQTSAGGNDDRVERFIMIRMCVFRNETKARMEISQQMKLKFKKKNQLAVSIELVKALSLALRVKLHS